MNTYPNYTDESRDITLFESNTYLRVFFTALFVSAVFIIPVVTAINFLLPAFSQ
jgi:hypothetical protein